MKMAYPPGYDTALTYQMTGLTLQQQSAGSTPLLSSFSQGNIVLLRSAASGQNLRIQDGCVNGNGGDGKLAQFTVHVRRPGVIALQNVHDSNKWLAILDGKLIGTGYGGPFCEFIVGEIEGRYVVLESCQLPGQRIGILPDGTIKSPYNTGTGQHGRFIPIVKQYATPPAIPPAVSQPVHGSYTALAAGHTTLLSNFTEGNIVIIHSMASGRDLRINLNGAVDGLGGGKKLAQFTVHVRRLGVVALQNVGVVQNWLCILGGITRAGNGDGYCEFYVKELDVQHFALESVIYPGHHVGILPNGQAKLPHETGTGQHGRFTVSVHYHNPKPPALTAPSSQYYPQQPSQPSCSQLPPPSQPVQYYSQPPPSAPPIQPPPSVEYYPQPPPPSSAPSTQPPPPVQYYPQQPHPSSVPSNQPPPPVQYYPQPPPPSNVPSTQPPPAVQYYPQQPHPSSVPSNQPPPPVQYYPQPPPPSNVPSYYQPPPTNPHTPPPPYTPQAPIVKSRAGDTTLLAVFEEGAKVRLRSCASGKNLRIQGGVPNGKGGEGPYATFIVHVRGPGVVSLQSVADLSKWLRIKQDGVLDGNGAGYKLTEFRVKQLNAQSIALESIAIPGAHVGILPSGEPKLGTATKTGLHGQFYPYRA